MRDFDSDWVDAAASTPTGPSSVELTKPAGDVGTSIETTNLGLDVAAGDVITVNVALGSDDQAAAGAVRMFYYDHPDSDTSSEAPTATVLAAGSGPLTIAVDEPGTIGTFGLTYDASNASVGTVTFSDLTVGDTPILFVQPEPEPTTEPTAEPTKPADPEPTDPAAPGQGGGGGGKPGLPVTGVPIPLLASGGAVAAGLGGLALWLARRRGATFTA